MPQPTSFIASMPFAVENGIKQLGRNLRIARLRRNLSLADVAEKLGVSRYVVSHAENGKASTSIAVYAGLLWTYGLLDQFSALANPEGDKEGMALSLVHGRTRARRTEALDNDF